MIIGLIGKAGSGKSTVAKYLNKKGYVEVALADPMKRFCRDVFEFSDEQLWGPSECRNAIHADSCNQTYWVRVKARFIKEAPRFARILCVSYIFKEEEELVDRLLVWFSRLADLLISPRIVLQTLGTECGRYFYQDIWINYSLSVSFMIGSGRYKYSQKEGLKKSWHPFNKTDVVISDCRFQNEVDGIHATFKGSVIQVVRPEMRVQEVGIKGHASETEQNSIVPDIILTNDGSLADLKKKVKEAINELSTN